MLSSMALLPGLAHAAATDLVWEADTEFQLDNGITLRILSSSKAAALTFNPTSIVVDVDVDASDFIIEAVAPATKMTNDGGYSTCTQTAGTSRLTITTDVTVTITPEVSGCGGTTVTSSGGGGGYVPPAATTCSVLSPNGGDSITGGSSVPVSWSTSGNGISSVLVSYSTNGGDTWSAVGAKDTTNGGTYNWVAPNAATSNGKVKVECRDSSGATLASDVSDSAFSIAVNAAQPVQVVTPTGVTSRAAANAALPANAKVDALVKLANDQAVYYIGLDGKRHPFPTSQAYFSWYPDFSKVKTISATEMASISLGKPILARPGSHWVKIQSDPKTYFVSPDGYTLRWIKDEATALTLGGSDWNKNIIDVEPTYFTKYKMGADIDSVTLAAGWPAGSLVKGNDGKTWYITGTSRREVLSSGMTGNWFQSKFVENSNGGWQALPIGDAISGMEEELSSLQNL